jgi:signal transduction histidine kinase
MPTLNPLLWRKPSLFWSYVAAVVLVAVALLLSRWPWLDLQMAPVSLFVCAVMISAWVGGFGPGILATALSSVAFKYYFLEPRYSFVLKPEELPRGIMFALTTLVIAALSAAERGATESLRRARDDLRKTVQDLRRANEALQTESAERKHAEDELRKAQADLARASRVTTMGELTASLAHEVNQPIAAAVTNANTSLRWLTRDQPDFNEAREAVLRVVKDARRAAEIVNRVRMLFQKGTAQRELLDVNEIIREMTLLLATEASRYSVSVRTELEEDLPRIMGDRVQLQQVLMNLMMNSIDAMKDVDGTHELMIESQRNEDGQVLISVSDTGVGLPREQADKIFNAFFTTKTHGTGMGLRISRSIVESHGGRLWAAENPPRGARFCFTLPTRGETRDSVVSGDRTGPADGLHGNNPSFESMNAGRPTQRE